MQFSKAYNSPENKRKRSEKSRRVITEYWDEYHRQNPVTYPPERPHDMYRITFENLMTGKTEVLLFHPGTRSNNYKIDVNDKPWKTCGFCSAMDRLQKSIYLHSRKPEF